MALWLTRGLGGIGRGITDMTERDRLQEERDQLMDLRRLAQEHAERTEKRDLIAQGGRLGEQPSLPLAEGFEYELPEPDFGSGELFEPSMSSLQQGLQERMPVELNAPAMPMPQFREPQLDPDFQALGEVGGQQAWVPTQARREQETFGRERGRAETLLREKGAALKQSFPELADVDDVVVARMAEAGSLNDVINRLRTFDPDAPDYETAKQAYLYEQMYSAMGDAYGGRSQPADPRKAIAVSALNAINTMWAKEQELQDSRPYDDIALDVARLFGFTSVDEVMGLVHGEGYDPSQRLSPVGVPEMAPSVPATPEKEQGWWGTQWDRVMGTSTDENKGYRLNPATFAPGGAGVPEEVPGGILPTPSEAGGATGPMAMFQQQLEQQYGHLTAAALVEAVERLERESQPSKVSLPLDPSLGATVGAIRNRGALADELYRLKAELHRRSIGSP